MDSLDHYYKRSLNEYLKYFPVPQLTDASGNVLEAEEENEIDPLDSVKTSVRMTQRQIVLGLQKRLNEMVEKGADIHEILSASQAIAVNIQIDGEILMLFE